PLLATSTLFPYTTLFRSLALAFEGTLGGEDLLSEMLGGIGVGRRKPAGDALIRHRRELIPKLSPLARLAYRRISNDAEELRIARSEEHTSELQSRFDLVC